MQFQISTKNENFVPWNLQSGDPWPTDKSIRSVEILIVWDHDKLEIFGSGHFRTFGSEIMIDLFQILIIEMTFFILKLN